MACPAETGWLDYPARQQAVGHPGAFPALDHPAHRRRLVDWHEIIPAGITIRDPPPDAPLTEVSQGVLSGLPGEPLDFVPLTPPQVAIAGP